MSYQSHLKRILRLSATLLIALVSTFQAQADKQPTYEGGKDQLHIYLLIGQSNMAGRGAIEDSHQTFPDKVYLLNHENSFEPATHPLNKYSTIRKGIELQKLNIGYSFAKSLREARPDISIGLVVNARGGSGIEEWKKGSHYYEETIKRVKAARKHGILKGILWHQGERNSGAPAGYDQKLARLIQDLRTDLGDASLPFVAGQIVMQEGTKEINRLISQLTEMVENTGYVGSEGLQTFERWHFDAPSIIQLGEGYAGEILKIQK